jgi:hypothetical protein
VDLVTISLRALVTSVSSLLGPQTVHGGREEPSR